MPPEENTPQPSPESPSPAVETPAPATEPTTPPQEASPATSSLEASPTPAEAVQVPETDQMAGNEPLPPKSDPIPPPSAAAPQAQPIIVPPTGNFIRNLLAKASAKIQSKKKAKLEKIMQALTTKTKITNDEVEKLLHVSDATATRYLSALEKEGKIIQVGKQGRGILYIKTP